LVDTGATGAVCFDVLPYPLVGVEFGRVGQELEQHSRPRGRSHEALDCFGPVDRIVVDNEKYRATGVVHQPLAEVDESSGFELTRVGGETQSPLRAQCRDEVDRVAGAGGAYDRSLPDWRPRGAGMEVNAHPRNIIEVDGRPHGGSLSADGWIFFSLPSLHCHAIMLVGSPQRTLRRQPQLSKQPPTLTTDSLTLNSRRINSRTISLVHNANSKDSWQGSLLIISVYIWRN
jgi:hypothetical protein